MGLISKLQRHMCLFRWFKICAIFERNTDFDDGQNPSHAIVIDANICFIYIVSIRFKWHPYVLIAVCKGEHVITIRNFRCFKFLLIVICSRCKVEFRIGLNG